MIIGASGTGKSEYIYKLITEEAGEHRDKRYFVIVPDQFTMQTQMDMVEHSPGKGIMNIDVLSFSRLAHRIFEETNAVDKLVLDDTGKSLVLRKLVSQVIDDVPYISGNLKRTGFIHEIKSSISEFMQYGIGDEELKQLIEYSSGKGALKAKLTDLSVLYSKFREYIGESYITTEESMDLLAKQLLESNLIKNSVVVFDGFTGFTPVQMRVLGRLFRLCDEVYITLTLDGEKTGCKDEAHELFAFTAKSYAGLMKLASDVGVDVKINDAFSTNYRFKDKTDLLYLERNIFRSIPKDKVFAEAPEHIELYEAADIQSEAGLVAQKIRELVAGGNQYRDIAVVTGNLGDYENHISREFAKFDIPVYMDKTRAVVLNPIVEFTKSMLRIFIKNFDADSVCRFLRTGLGGFDMEQVDVFDNFCQKSGLRGKKAYTDFDEYKSKYIEQKKKAGKLSDRAEKELEVVSQIVEKLGGIIAPALDKGITATGLKPVTTYVEALYECYLKADAYSSLKAYEEKFKEEGNYIREKEYSQVYRATMELLEQIHSLLGNEEIALEEFSDILEAGFDEITLGTIPQSVDKVIVGDIERSRLKPVKYLFFMGLMDGNIPKKGGKTSILSDMEREFLAGNGQNLELSPTPHQKMFIQRFYLYSNLVKPSEKLILSFSKMDNAGKSLRPAYIIPMLKRMYPKLECTCASVNRGLDKVANMDDLKDFICALIRKYGETGLNSEEHKELMDAMSVLSEVDDGYRQLLEMFIENSFYKYEDKKLDGVIAGILYGETLLASISRMEQYAECAYAYFLKYGLSLKEKQLYQIDNRDMGTIFHETLKAYGKILEERQISWMDISKQESKEILDKQLRIVCGNLGKNSFSECKADEYIYGRMSKVLYKAADTLTYQLKAGQYEVFRLEEDFDRYQVIDELNLATKVQESMKINGRIDRIDTMDTGDNVYVKVIDYKTGDKDFSLLNFYHGTQLQLVVYLNEAVRKVKSLNKDKAVVPGALLYYHLADDMVKADLGDDEETINSKIRESLKTKGLINDDEISIKGISGIESTGKSDVVPVSINKDGSYSKTSSVMSLENIRLLQDFAGYKIRNIGDDIIQGKIDMNPLKESYDRDSCTYCTYRGICEFDERIDGFNKVSLKKEADEVLLDMMKQEMEAEENG